MPHAAATPALPTDTGADRVRGRLMASSLTTLLDRVRGAREVLPYLAALERGLVQHGASAIERIPPRGLARICSQLSSLPIPRDDRPLLDLVQRVMDTLEALHPQFRSTFASDSQMLVAEASHSDFIACAQAQARAGPDTGSEPQPR
jgi:hypothetical protein